MFSFDDYKKNFEEMFSKSPINLEDFYKSANEYNSKFSKIAFDTFKKNVEVSQDWTKETIGGMDKLVKPQSKPEDYVKVATDFVTEQAQTSPKYMSEFAEIAKKTQLDTIELFMQVGKEAKEEMNKVAKKATAPKQTPATETQVSE